MTGHLERFQALMRSQYRIYQAACAERDFEDLGYVLMLDRSFANPKSRLAFLGINPGGTDPVQCHEPWTRHSIWNTREAGRKERGYWGITRIVLERALQDRDDLSQTIDEAFFGNVIPFRSRLWSETKRAHQDLMRECAQAVTEYLFDEDLYDTIIAVGGYPTKPLALQPHAMIRDRTEVCLRFPEPDEHWPRGCEDRTVRRASGRSVRILKIPHLSRIGFAAADRIGDWLGRRLPRPATAPA